MQPIALRCRVRLLALLAAGALAAGCGDPNDPATMVGSLSGMIRDAATDAPLAGATVEVAGIEGETGSDGSYLIASVPVGTHQGTVAMEGYLSQTFEAEVRAGAATTLALELARGGSAPSTTGSLSGVVRDATTGAPINEASVLVVGEANDATGSDGSYRIDNISPGTHQVSVSRHRYLEQTAQVEIRAGDVTGLSFDLVLNPIYRPPPTITTSTLPQATVDVPYRASLEASGGTPPYAWSWGGAPGLLLDAASGVVSGTPEFPAGKHPVRVALHDADGASASRELTIEFGAASGLRITSLELGVGEAGEPYADTLRAAGGAPPYTFEWVPSVHFEGLTLDPATGALSGTPFRPTSPDGQPDTALVTVRDAIGASAIADVAIGIRPGPLVIVTENLPDGQVGIFYQSWLHATGGYGDLTWTVIAGTLPPGIRLISQSVYGSRVEGRPTTGGTFTFTLRASDGRVQDAQQYEVVIAGSSLSIVTSSLPNADVGTPYSIFLVREGGTGPFTWDVVSGNLPSGISLSSQGELAGTPTAAGDASFAVRVRDAGSQSATAGLNLHVDP